MRLRCALILVAVLPPLAAEAETLEHLRDGAFCRTAQGKVRDPQAAPASGAAAHRAENGMIVTDRPVAGGPCYLYRSDARLAPPCPMPPADKGGAGNGIAGALGRCDSP